MILRFYFKLYLTIIFVLICKNINAQSPDWLWAKSLGGATGHDRGYSVCISQEGNLYSTGMFSGTVDFDPSPAIFNLTSSGVSDIFISKTNSDGDLIWAKAIGGGGINGHAFGESITIDNSGSTDIFITGKFQDTVDFDPGLGIFYLVSNGGDACFVSRFDSSGNLIWAKAIEGSGNLIIINSITSGFAGNGEVYYTGTFGGTVDFDPGPGVFNLTASGNLDSFISKLDGSGNFLWAIQIGEAGIINQSDRGFSIAMDPTGNGVYATGSFGGTVDFDPGSGVFNLTSAGLADVFIVKYDNSGNIIWAKAIGGISDDIGRSITVDQSSVGDIYIAGSYMFTADYDPDVGVFNLSSAGGSDIFVAKYTNTGNLIWAKSMGGILDDIPSELVVDPAGLGDVYTTGRFRGTADFDPGPGVYNLTSSGLDDIFVLRLDHIGNFIYAKSANSIDSDFAVSITIDATKHLYVTGYFKGPTISFGADTLINAGFDDCFIAKLDTLTFTGNIDIADLENDILIYPNPFSDFISITISNQYKNIDQLVIKIKSQLGQTLFSIEEVNYRSDYNKTIDLGFLSHGIYLLEVNVNEKLVVKKIVKK